KTITVTCNDATQPTTTLQIQANIWRPIDMQPAFLHFMPTEGEETNETKTVRIVSNLEQPITLQAPESSNPVFKTELKTIQPGKQFELNITHTGPITNGLPNATINVKTSVTNMPVLSVTAYVLPQPPIAALPTQVQLPAPQAAAHKAYVTIRINSRIP